MRKTSRQRRPRTTRPPKPPSANDYRALAAFRYSLQRYLVFADQSARASGLSRPQYIVLLALKGAPPDSKTTIGYLAERLKVRHHSAVGLVDRMTKRGLVRRSAGDTDQREVFVYLTSKGNRLLQSVAGRNLAELRSAHADLKEILRAVL